jgi:hypothetical protein
LEKRNLATTIAHGQIPDLKSAATNALMLSAEVIELSIFNAMTSGTQWQNHAIKVA